MPRSLEENTSFIRVANEIINLTSSENVTVPLDLCVYMLELKLLQISKSIPNVIRNPDLKEILIKKCVNELKDDSLSMKIIKLQLLWWKKYRSRDEIKKIHHERVFVNVLPIMTEIAEEVPVKAFDKDHFYKKIVIFVIMFAGLGSPTEQTIIKEAQAALHSIFKTSEVENFLSLPKATKEQQLVEFARLITGILLFNKDCKKGGEGMDDLPLILTQGVQATKERLLSFKDQLDQKIDEIAKALLQAYNLQGSKEKVDCLGHEIESSTPEALKKKNLEELKSLLIYLRQIEYCLNDLMKDLEKSTANVEDLVRRLQYALLQLHNVVRYRVAVATVQVFPLFIQLSNVWVEMQEEIDILSEINNNFVELSVVVKNLSLPASLQLPMPSEDPVPVANEIRYCPEFYSGVKVCSVSSASFQEYLQYKGFCAWTLVHTQGLLITGNFTIGALQYSNRFYCFSSAEAAQKWAMDPNFYIKSVLELARKRPELIKFLRLEDDLKEKLTTDESEKPTTSNAQIQTELHSAESLLDKDYTFSEWELKKRVLKLATLTRCSTRSQQTGNRSCFRTETGIQVTPCKNVTTQTTKDAYCNHPATVRSAWGLRTEKQLSGAKAEMMQPEVISLLQSELLCPEHCFLLSKALRMKETVPAEIKDSEIKGSCRDPSKTLFF